MIKRLRQVWLQVVCVMVLLSTGLAFAQQATQVQQPEQVQQARQAEITNKVSTAVTATAPSKNVVVLGSAASMGALLMLIGIVWIIITILRGLTGNRPRFSKPIILILIGVILFMLPRMAG